VVSKQNEAIACHFERNSLATTVYASADIASYTDTCPVKLSNAFLLRSAA